VIVPVSAYVKMQTTGVGLEPPLDDTVIDACPPKSPV
jgi:hypothetical protein